MGLSRKNTPNEKSRIFKMLLAKKALSIALLSTVATAIATVSYAGSAQALSMTYSSGTYRDANVTNQGSFSAGVNQEGYETFDFNKVKVGELPGNDKVKYSYSGNNKNPKKKTEIVTLKNREIVWAPAGVKGEKNKSQYSQVFQGKNLIVETAKKGDTFTYFGLNVGALSSGNSLQFFNGVDVVSLNYKDANGIAQVASTLTFEILTKLAPTSAKQHGGQTNGFFEFFSTGFSDNFDKIVFSQTNGNGGFETDNHTFRIGKGAYTASVPEPGVVLGLASVGGMLLRSRKKQKTA
jgi:hypothetical protein